MTALACTELQSGLTASQIGPGLPASSSAPEPRLRIAVGGQQRMDRLAAQANCGSFVPPASYPGIRGAMTWSINWDAANGHNFADKVAPHLASLPSRAWCRPPVQAAPAQRRSRPPAWPPMSADSPFLRSSNGGNTA